MKTYGNDMLIAPKLYVMLPFSSRRYETKALSPAVCDPKSVKVEHFKMEFDQYYLNMVGE